RTCAQTDPPPPPDESPAPGAGGEGGPKGRMRGRHTYNHPMHPRRKGVLLVAAAAVLWSTGGLGIKAVAEPALKVTFYRSLFAAIALMIFLPRDAWATRRWSSTPAFIAAIVSYAACLTTFVIATKWTTAANAIFL